MPQCSDEDLAQLIAVAQAGAGDELALAERLLDSYPEDAKLHFLRGSMLAGAGRLIEAHVSLSRARSRSRPISNWPGSSSVSSS